MQKLSIVLLLSAALAATSGCATKKYVRNTVTASADTLNARIDTTDSNLKETRDTLDRKVTDVNTRVTGVDSRVSALDAKTAEGINSLKTDVQGVDQRAGQARTAADRAQGDVSALGQRFQNRNNFNVADDKSIYFKFDSAKLDEQYHGDLDQIAAALMQNPDAIVVLEGRTDSTGNKDYNVRLGERRIDAVRRYLAVEKGVPVYKIHEISFGSEKPIAENKTKDGREQNRAVTMTIMTPKMDANVASRNN